MVFDPFVAKVLLEEISQGDKSIKAILEARKEFYPSRATLWKWLRENEQFAADYAVAKREQIDSYVDDTVHKADEAKPENANVVALQIKTRQWQAERLNAKTYGSHIKHDHTAFVQTSQAPLLEHLTPEERDQVRAIVTNAMRRQSSFEADQRTASAPVRQIEAKANKPKAKRRA